MSETKVEKQAEIDRIAQGVLAASTIDTTTGIGPSQPDLYKELLPADLPYEMVQKNADYRSNFVTGTAKAVGQQALEAMKGNKDLQRVTASFTADVNDSLTISVDREVSYPNPQDPSAKIQKFGVVSAKYETRAAHNSGALKALRTQIGLDAAEALNNSK